MPPRKQSAPDDTSEHQFCLALDLKIRCKTGDLLRSEVISIPIITYIIIYTPFLQNEPILRYPFVNATRPQKPPTPSQWRHPTCSTLAQHFGDKGGDSLNKNQRAKNMIAAAEPFWEKKHLKRRSQSRQIVHSELGVTQVAGRFPREVFNRRLIVVLFVPRSHGRSMSAMHPLMFRRRFQG